MTESGDTMDPPGGHDPQALKDAAEKMGLDEKSDELVPDPPGGHDPEALKDAEEKMGIQD